MVELCHLEPGDNGTNSVNESFNSPIIISAFIVRIHLSQLNKKATSRNHIQTTSKQSKTKNIASVPFCSSCPMKTSLHSPQMSPFYSFLANSHLPPATTLFFVLPMVPLQLHSLPEGIQSSLKQQDSSWQEQWEAAEATLGRGCTSDSVVVWRIGVQSGSVPRTLTS